MQKKSSQVRSSQQPAARRKAVAGRPGVYRRVGADGKPVFEIGYRDRDGRQRWQTVAGGLQDAVAAREEARSRVRRGELNLFINAADAASDRIPVAGSVR